LNLKVLLRRNPCLPHTKLCLLWLFILPYSPFYCCFVWPLWPIFDPGTHFLCCIALFSLILMIIIISNHNPGILNCIGVLFHKFMHFKASNITFSKFSPYGSPMVLRSSYSLEPHIRGLRYTTTLYIHIEQYPMLLG
jgi:hypothetical protein